MVGMLSGRDPAAMLEALLAAGIRSVVACAPDSPRALPAEAVAEAATRLGMDVRPWPGLPPRRVHLALGRAGPDDLVVVCGSLYVVADARRAAGRTTPPGRTVGSGPGTAACRGFG